MGAFFFKFCSLLRKYELKFILLRVCYFWSCHCRICVLPHEIEIEGQHQFIVAKTWWCSKPRGQNVEYLLSAQNLPIQTQSCAAVGLQKKTPQWGESLFTKRAFLAPTFYEKITITKTWRKFCEITLQVIWI